MFNRKSIASGAAAAALVSMIGLAYAQTTTESQSAALPDSSQSDRSSMPTYSASDSSSAVDSATSSAPSPATESLDTESYSEPAPQADRN